MSTESSPCGAIKNDGMNYCNNRTRHPSGFCPSHRRNADGECPPLRKGGKVKPEIFTRELSRIVGRMYEETPIHAKSVFLRFGQGEVELSWNHGMKAFEIKTMHKGLRDGMTMIPDSSNRIFIRIGDR